MNRLLLNEKLKGKVMNS